MERPLVHPVVIAKPLIEVGRRTGTPPQWHQFAVEVLTQPDGGRAVPMEHRLFFTADDGSLARFAAASVAYQCRRETHPATLPDMGISDDDRFDSRLIDYGYRQWTELFNPRQLLHLSLLAEAIETYDQPIRTALSMAFSDHLTTNCMLTSYAAGWRRLSPLFSIRAFRHIPRPVELNPWVDRSGRGSFPNAVRKLMRAASYARDPREPLRSGGFTSVPAVDAEHPPRVHCGTARKMCFLKAASVDLVLTDPPYFDNIAYAELAEFFLPWLCLLDVVSAENGVEQIMVESLVGRRNDPETIQHYTAGLSDAFAEVARVLKPTGVVVFSYRHILSDAWLALAHAIAPHPLSAGRVLPLPGEAGVGLHTHEGTGLWDAVFVLRRDAGEAASGGGLLRVTAEDIAAAEVAAAMWVNRLKKAPLAFTDVDRVTLRRAALVGAALVPHRNRHSSQTVLLAQALAEAT